MAKEVMCKDEKRGNARNNSTRTRGKRNPRSKKTVDKVENTRFKDKADEVGLSSKDKDNDPNWYFLDKTVAEQVSQLSMRNFAGKDVTGISILGGGYTIQTPSIFTVYLNPSAGANAYPSMLRNSGINMSGYRMYTKLSAFTGRALTYQPQNISFMILAMGEVISLTEYIRRAFGVAYTYNQRNRSYPRQVLRAMGFNADDLSQNYALYRNRFNQLVTRMNQIPIPKSVAYFDKCASLYEKVYLDTDSPMAQTIITRPYTTWILNEGTTSTLTTRALPTTIDTMTNWMNVLELQISTLLNSSTLNVVYADLMNYYNKVGGEVWLFDYLVDGYQVLPEFNLNFLLQMHNATSVNAPAGVTTLVNTTDSQGNPFVITPSNDVYEDPGKNALLYSPAFPLSLTTHQFPKSPIVDFITPNPTVEDRIECTRFTSVYSNEVYDDGNRKYHISTCLPDHYVVTFSWVSNDESSATIQHGVGSVITSSSTISDYLRLSLWDWAPIIYSVDSNGDTDDYMLGDLNFYTTIDYGYLDPINTFVALGLYDLR